MKEIDFLSVLAVIVPLNSTGLSSQEYFSPINSEIKMDSHLVFQDLGIYSKPISVSSEYQKVLKYISRLKRIKNLGKNWDGQNSSKLNPIVIKNTFYLLNKIPDYLLIDINNEDISPSPYGTIFIELEKNENEMTIEIGENEISYFSEANNVSHENEDLNIIENQMDADEIIQNLQRVFQ